MRSNESRSIIVTRAVIANLALLSCSACDRSGAPSAEKHIPAPSAAPEVVGSKVDEHALHAGHDHSQHVLPADAPLATESVYHTRTQLSDQEGRPFELSSLRGSVVLATMFYASCTSVCPMLIAQLDRVVAALPNDARAQTHVLLVSLDPQRDDAESLKKLAERHKITDSHWHFLRTDSAGVREIAALLGVRYRQLPDGEISHSPVITLLDRNGVIIERMENGAGDPAQLIAATSQAVRSSSAQATR